MHLIYISVLSILFVGLSHEDSFNEVVDRWDKTIHLIQGDCVKQTNVDTDIVTRWVRYGEYPDNQKLKCFIRCLADAVNAIGNDGKFVKETLFRNLDVRDPEVEAKVEGKCSMDYDVNGDICQAAFDVNKCLRRATEEAFGTK